MTVHLGIDLGTTNSSVSLYDGTTVRVLEHEGHRTTPSALYFAQGGRQYVGRRAYNSLPYSPGRVAVGFKRLLGSSTPIDLPDAGLSLSPDACSSDLLRELYGVYRDAAHPPEGCVITVPAAFNQMQKEATLRAAEAAGIGRVKLLQEPVAAVMRSMLANPDDGRFLVFDIGGGTLDIAIAESAARRVNVVAVGGIEMCGGRDIDRALVDHLILPWLDDQFSLGRMRSNPTAMAKLRRVCEFKAEEAKIALSRGDSAVIFVADEELALTDDNGTPVFVDVPVTRTLLAPFIDQMLERAVDAAVTTVREAGMTLADLQQIVLVGGPTAYPDFSARVSNALGLAVREGIDPMTAVSEGAAIYAESVDWQSEHATTKSTRGGATAVTIPVTFAYTARTPAAHSHLAVKLNGVLNGRYEYQLESRQEGWSSGRMPLAEGHLTQLPLVKPGENHFTLTVFGPDGTRVLLPIEQFTITRTAAVVDAIPAAKTIFVEVQKALDGPSAKQVLVAKNAPLPAKGRFKLQVTQTIRANEATAARVKVWEGDADEIARNRYVGVVEVSGHSLTDGLIPAGAVLECDWAVAESGTISITVSAADVRATFRPDQELYSPQTGPDYRHASALIESGAADVRARAETLAEAVSDEALDEARAVADAADAAAVASESNPEAAKHALDAIVGAQRLLADVRRRHLVQIRERELAGLVQFFDEGVRPHASLGDIGTHENLVSSARRVVSHADHEFETCVSSLRTLNFGVLWRQDWFVTEQFYGLTQAPHLFTAPDRVLELHALGKAALAEEDYNTLRDIVQQLHRLKMAWSSSDAMYAAPNVVSFG